METQIPELELCHIIITENSCHVPNSSLGEANMAPTDAMYLCLCVWLDGDEWIEGNAKKIMKSHLKMFLKLFKLKLSNM